MKIEQKKLEIVISTILRVGVLASLVLLSAGIVAYYFSEGTVEVRLDESWKVSTQNFFTFIPYTASNHSLAFLLIASGIIALMLTPYLRVLASIAYFALTRDLKYLTITTIVMIIITASLLRF